jgi:two-component system sensor histidine kinase KdpD
VVVGSRVRQRPALVASVLSIALFDFCFVPPYFTFAVHDVTYVLTFGMMLAIAVIMSRLTGRIREQADASRARDQRTASAFALSRELAAAREAQEIIAAAILDESRRMTRLVANLLDMIRVEGGALSIQKQ